LEGEKSLGRHRKDRKQSVEGCHDSWLTHKTGMQEKDAGVTKGRKHGMAIARKMG
jgi:hypothetical protein